MPFNISPCIRGRYVDYSDQKELRHWTVGDQIEYLKYKIAIVERDVKFRKSRFKEISKKNCEIIRSLQEAAKKGREWLRLVTSPDSKVITDALKNEKVLWRAFQNSTCLKALWNMEQILCDLCRRYDALKFQRKQLETKLKFFKKKSYNCSVFLKNIHNPGPNKKLLEVLGDVRGEFQNAKQRMEALHFLAQQYNFIHNILADDLKNLDDGINALQLDNLDQIKEMHSLKKIYEESQIGKSKIISELKELESLIYQKSYSFEIEIQTLKQRVQLTNEKILEFKITGATTPVDDSPINVKQDRFEMETVTQMYENILTKLKEVLETSDLTEMEHRIVSQMIMTKHLIDKKNKLYGEYYKLHSDRLLLQQKLFENNESLDWRVSNMMKNHEVKEKLMNEIHCQGYKLQRKLDRMGNIFNMSEEGINAIIWRLSWITEKASLDDEVENEDEKRENFIQDQSCILRTEALIKDAKSKIENLIALIKETEFLEHPVPFWTFMLSSQLEIPEDNLKVKLEKDWKEQTPMRMAYMEESEPDEEGLLPREKAKAETAKFMEAMRIKRRMQDTGDFF